MTPKMVNEVFRSLQEKLMQKSVLRKMKLTKKKMQSLLKNVSFRNQLGSVLEGRQVSCEEVLSLCEEIMRELSPVAPESGWLQYICLLYTSDAADD